MLQKVVLGLLIILLLRFLRGSKYVIILRSYDYSVDLWSFGVVLYEICHGKVPFYGKDLQQLRKNIQNAHPKLRSDLHEDIKLIIRGCLMKDPKNRFSLNQLLSKYYHIQNCHLFNSISSSILRLKNEQPMIYKTVTKHHINLLFDQII